MFDRIRRFMQITFGEGVLAQSDSEDLFEISTGYVTLGSHDFRSLNRAGLCFGSVDAAEFDRTIEEIEGLLSVSETATTESQEVYEDEYGYTWVVLENADFEELVTVVKGAADTLVDAGFGEYLLCAVFGFERDRTAYLIYNFKRGTWYPFVPIRQGKRDDDTETTIEELLSGELDLETVETREYAFWDIPF